jgi:hypothetical protein
MYKGMKKVFIGFDDVESVAWHTMAHSILSRSTSPLAIVPLKISNLAGLYDRPRDIKQSNEFSFSRFLVPFLCDYSGFAAYFDCDMLMRVDITELFDKVCSDQTKAVHVVQHDYVPKNDIKYLGTAQYPYPRKNWSSMVVWNCSHPANRAVTPEYVNSATAMQLHRFDWLQDAQIGELDRTWNWLVGEYPSPPANVRNVHWTIGGPYFNEYKSADFAEEWFEERGKVLYCKQRSV